MADHALSLERVCSIEGCDRPTGIPGTARGWCTIHYGRWQRNGDPLLVRRKRNRCTVNDCDAYVRARGLCMKHLHRFNRHGTTEPPKPWIDLPEGMRWCTGCQGARPADQFSGKHSVCRPCAADVRRRWRSKNPVHAPRVATRCAACGTSFDGDKRNRLYCSGSCRKVGKLRYDTAYERPPERRHEANKRWRESHPDTNRDKSQRYRARKIARHVEDVSSQAVLERDGWVCRLCGFLIDRSLSYPDPMSQSVDHRIPLIAGGEHSMANCQAAHLICNIRKGASIVLTEHT